jgi:ABC-type phosphate/phosphonate transport system substrate-binding protein
MYTEMRKTIAALVLILGVTAAALADEPTRATSSRETTRIGAVAYSPSVVTVFQGLTRYLSGNGLPSDYVLYSNYDALVEALDRGEIDIAWNTPLAHAQYHLKNDCSSQTLVMRDVDVGLRCTIVVRADSGIQSLSDLAGKRLVLGSSQAAEATVLPIHFLKQEGVDLNRVKIVSLDAEVDSEGNPCASPQHVLRAVREGRGDAGIITEGLWNHVKDQQDALQQVWTSPEFSHCVFTAAADFDQQRAGRFARLMQAMDPEDDATKDVMRLEGTRKWLAGSDVGFRDLVEALRAEQLQ